MLDGETFVSRMGDGMVESTRPARGGPLGKGDSS